MTIFRPSAAPLWKITTRILRREFVAAVARASQAGALPTPNIAMAEFLRNALRYILRLTLPPLEFRGSQNQTCDDRSLFLLRYALLDRFLGRFRNVHTVGSGQHFDSDTGETCCVLDPSQSSSCRATPPNSSTLYCYSNSPWVPVCDRAAVQVRRPGSQFR